MIHLQKLINEVTSEASAYAVQRQPQYDLQYPRVTITAMIMRLEITPFELMKTSI